MDINQALALLGGMTPQRFMARHWQKKPLLIRNAVPGLADGSSPALLSPAALFGLAQDEAVESRLVVQNAKGGKSSRGAAWTLRQGPFQRRALPPLRQPGWSLLVQGVDQQVQAVRALMDQFRFIPDARLDDVMVSFATRSGGVGPHFDSYDVFLLQAHGRRRWQISAQKDLTLQDGVPLKILQNFLPDQTFDLEPGDMLYLPPRYAHDGVAMGDCMTYSIGFRAPAKAELARELLQRLADDTGDVLGAGLYADPRQTATAESAAIPPALLAFAQAAVLKSVSQPALLAQLLGECLTEPKANVWFDGGDAPASGRKRSPGAPRGISLDRRTKMLFDSRHVFINGESVRATGADARLMQALANQRFLDALAVGKASAGARALLADWLHAGWLHES